VIGANIRALRVAAGLTQAELGQAMVEMGFPWQSRQTVAEVEAGRRHVAPEELVALAAYFDVPINKLFMGAGFQLPYNKVRVGKRSVGAGTWAKLTAPRSDREPPNEHIQPAIDEVVGDLDRPWSRLWRERGGHPQEAFAEAWRERQGQGRRLPGPIYVTTEKAEGRVAFNAVVGPWLATVEIVLEDGIPYVARDEAEAEALADRERQGFVRRITRQEAYRMRRRKRDGMDS